MHRLSVGVKFDEIVPQVEVEPDVSLIHWGAHCGPHSGIVGHNLKKDCTSIS